MDQVQEDAMLEEDDEEFTELDKLEKLRDEALTASNMDQAQEDAMIDALLSSKAYCQTNRTLRRARVSNPKESMKDEYYEQILSEMKKQIKKEEIWGQERRTKHYQ